MDGVAAADGGTDDVRVVRIQANSQVLRFQYASGILDRRMRPSLHILGWDMLGILPSPHIPACTAHRHSIV